MITKNFVVKNEDEYDEVILYLNKLLDNTKLLFLKGDLGAGKTSFVKNLVNKYNNKVTVTSPTYNILNIYESGEDTFYHYDLYRIKNVEEIYELGFYENLESGMSIIEWPDIVENSLNKIEKIIVEIEVIENFFRSVTIKHL